MRSWRRITWIFAGSLLLVLPACSGDDVPAPAPENAADAALHLTDVTAASGIDLVTTSGSMPPTVILEVKGGGLALIDFDGDDDLDVFVPNGATLGAPETGPGCRLYENMGDLVFRDATARAELDFRGWGMGVAVGDVDDDGDDDLYIAAFGRDVLLQNQGDGTFRDVTEASGIDLGGWSTGCTFGDLDADGDLDLYVARYIDLDLNALPAPSVFRGHPVVAGPRGLTPQGDRLYENVGEGRFRDITDASGAGAMRSAYGLGAIVLDLDGDERADVFVGNDSVPNGLLSNRGSLRFEDTAARAGVATTGDGSSRATMGIAVADVDGDGRPDLYTSNFAGEANTLHLSRPGGFFDDGTRLFGMGMPTVRALGWACGFFDLDLDGDEDLLIVNGHVYRAATAETMISDYRQPASLFIREGDRFAAATPDTVGAWLADPRCDRSAVFGDLDADGDIDVITSGVNEAVRVLRNDAAAGAWLIVEPEGNGYGCRVDVSRGDRVWRRWIVSGTGFLSASPDVAHFGLGPSDAAVAVDVHWPDGTVSSLRDVDVRQRLVVRRPGAVRVTEGDRAEREFRTRVTRRRRRSSRRRSRR